MSEALAPGTRLGPYEIGSLIGAGGMGQVYRARDPRLGRHVAIKTLSGTGAADPEGVRRFETEARAAGTLDHPNLLVVYDVGREGAVSYIVSELLEGETLRERLRNGAVPERQAIDYAVQIAQGLAAAHDRGIIHRDLKPENLFLTRDRPREDPGLRRGETDPHARGRCSPRPSPTPSRVRASSWARRAIWRPSRSAGEPIDHRADIFALGVVMHEMLSGTRPFQRDTTPETLTAILKDDSPDLPPGVTPALARVVRRCLEKRRDDRFHSAHDLGLALDLLSTMTVSRHHAGREPAGRGRAAPRGAALWRRVAGPAGIGARGRRDSGPPVSARRPAVVPPADVQARAHPIGTLRARRPDDPLRSALGRRPMPRAQRFASTAPNRARSICPMRTCWRFRDPESSRSRSDRTSTGSSPTARWRACRSPAVRRARCSRT